MTSKKSKKSKNKGKNKKQGQIQGSFASLRMTTRTNNDRVNGIPAG
jgi:hypothetical protein